MQKEHEAALMILHLAIGDAYGVGFEDVRPDLIRVHNDLGGKT